MKAIILAAGIGSRFGRFLNNRPKCLLKIGGKSILERQISLYHRCGINEIIIIKGYGSNNISEKDVRYYVNENYTNTNMVYTLFCAKSELEGNVIISYADILFEKKILRTLIQTRSYDIAVAVDTHWEDYYRERFLEPFDEAESLIYDNKGLILEIGSSYPTPNEVMAQYIGLIRLSDDGCKMFRELYDWAEKKYLDKPWKRERLFQKIYMTDFLQAMIEFGYPVHAFPIKHGWLEFDNMSDYQKALEWYKKGTLDRFCSID